jgi:hypothetical protein
MQRRQFLSTFAQGGAQLALLHLLQDQGKLRADEPIRPQIDPKQPYAARPPHFAPKAKQVLIVFCSGACSHLDSWDYKPELWKRDGQPMPGENLITFQGENGNLTRSPYAFRPRGQTGKMVSELFPQLGNLADDFCFIHSMTSRTNTHGPGENFMSTGFTIDGFPSLGAWVSYALGSERENLPSYVAIPDPRGVPQSGGNNWNAGFLPSQFQGTPVNGQKPIENLARPDNVSAEEDAAVRQFLGQLNRQHLKQFQDDDELQARIASYELAAKMQLAVPDILDWTQEPAYILKEYGADDASNPLRAGFARNCLVARRMLENGVRIVQLFNGAYAMGEGVGNWDGHKTLKQQYDIHGPILDQPLAALLTDMKRRGMFQDTLVVWCTEFGRMPTFQKGASGRDHNPNGFTCWMAGAGVKPGYSYGATDEFGHRAIDKVTTVYDFHATILHLMGLNHKQLTYYHNGAERRLTDVHGDVVQEILT